MEKPKKLRIGVNEKWNTSDFKTLKMWGVVYADVDGFLVIHDERFRADKESVENIIQEILANNNHEKLTKLFGKNFLSTVEARQIECYMSGYPIQVCNYPFWQHWERYVEKCAEETK